MSTNVQTVSQSARPVTTPKIDGSEAQGSLPVGPTGQVHRGGGVPWHKRLALTKAPSPTAHHVLLVLGSFVSDGQSEAWPSVVTLASMTGLTRRTVQRALRALEDDRLVQTETVSGRPSRYRLASTCVTVTPLPASQLRPPRVTVTPEVLNEGTSTRKAAALPLQNIGSSVPERHTCSRCDRSWPAAKGETCYQCGTSVRSGRLQREYGDRLSAHHHHAGQASPTPKKYDDLF